MSVIQDALKRAQREGRRRLGISALPTAPEAVLVPLRSTAHAGFSWVRSLSVGVVGALVIASVIIGVQIRQSAKRPTLPAVPPPPAADLIASPPAMGGGLPPARSVYESQPSMRSNAREPVRPEARSADATPPQLSAGPSLSKMQDPVDPGVAAATEAIALMPQGQPRPESAGSSTSQDTRLRIALDRPRNGEAARMFADAVIAHRNNDLVAARNLYEQVFALTPDDPDLLNNLGVLLSSQHEMDRAIALLKRSVTLAPANAGAWTNLGFALREAGRSAEAVTAFQRALALDPKRPGAQISLAQQYIGMGSISQARDLVDRIIAADSTSAEAFYTRGQILEIMGDRAAAVLAYQSFLRLAPPRLESYSELVRRHLDTLAAKPAMQ